MLPQQIKIPYIKGTVVGFYYDSLGHAKGEVIQVPFQECRISGENPEYIYWFAPDYSIIVLENCKLVYVETKLGIADVQHAEYQDFSDNYEGHEYGEDAYNENPAF